MSGYSVQKFESGLPLNYLRLPNTTSNYSRLLNTVSYYPKLS